MTNGLLVPVLLALAFSPPQGPEGGSLLFGGPWIVRLEDGIHGPCSGDFDGDGLTDLAVVNNAKARIELLLQRRPGTYTPPAPGERNVPADDPRFERRWLITEKRVGGLATGDFNGDGRADLAWYGNPKTLVVAYQGEKGAFERRQEFDIPDGSESAHALQAGDLDGDGRTDLVLLAEDDILLIRQGKDGLGEPVRVAAVLGKVGYVRIGDFNGDGRRDLLLVPGNDPSPLRFRFQREDGTLGPEIPFRFPTVRSLTPVPGEKGTDLLAIPQASGALRRLRMKPETGAEGGIALGRIRLFAFGGAKGPRNRSVAVGDVDGDGRLDVLATDPKAARVLLYRQTAAGALGGPEPFPCYREATSARIADVDGDGRNDVALLSADEKSVGYMSWQEGRLTFPRAIPLSGDPQALEAADWDGDGRTDLAVALREKKATRIAVLFGGAGAREGDRVEIPLEGAGDVAGLLAADLDHDGKTDLLVLQAFDDLRVLRGTGGRSLAEVPAKTLLRETPVRQLTPANTTIAVLAAGGKPDLLIAARNYARAVHLRETGEAAIRDQVNGPPSAEIVAAAAADLDGDGVPEAALLDKSTRSLLILRRDARGLFQEVRRVDVGEFDHAGLLAEDLTGDGRKDLLVLGTEKFGLIPSGGLDLAPVEGPPYESKERGAHLSWMESSDLGGPPGHELVVVDSGNSTVEILSETDKGWERLAFWKVFERKSFEARMTRSDEPHALHLADLSGDGQADLILLAHDRVLVYPRQ